MTETNPNVAHLSINVSGRTSPIKRKEISGWLKKQNPSLCSIQETYLKQSDSDRLQIKGCAEIY